MPSAFLGVGKNLNLVPGRLSPRVGVPHRPPKRTKTAFVNDTLHGLSPGPSAFLKWPWLLPAPTGPPPSHLAQEPQLLGAEFPPNPIPYGEVLVPQNGT